MAPSVVPTTTPTYHTHTTYTTTCYLRTSYCTDTSVDYEYTYTKIDDSKEKERIKYYMRLENKIESIEAIQALARIKRGIEDVCVRQFIFKAIRQPKPKSNLKARLYK